MDGPIIIAGSWWSIVKFCDCGIEFLYRVSPNTCPKRACNAVLSKTQAASSKGPATQNILPIHSYWHLRQRALNIKHLKVGFKQDTHSMIKRSLYIQDTKSPSLPMISLSFMAQKHPWMSKSNHNPQNSNLKIQRHSRSISCLKKSHKISFKI